MRLRLLCATSILANSSANWNDRLIGRLTGALIEIDAEKATLMVDVGGVGYELEVSTNVLATAPAIGQPITLSTHFVVREDAQLLFGFCDTAERVVPHLCQNQWRWAETGTGYYFVTGPINAGSSGAE